MATTGLLLWVLFIVLFSDFEIGENQILTQEVSAELGDLDTQTTGRGTRDGHYYTRAFEAPHWDCTHVIPPYQSVWDMCLGSKWYRCPCEMRPRKIAIDFDEVLFPYRRLYCEFHNVPLADIRFTRESVYEFESSEFFQTLANHVPIQGSVDALAALKTRGHPLILITDRAWRLEALTTRLLDMHFPGVFEEVILTNRYVSEYAASKADYFKGLGCDVLIDDSLSNCVDLEKEGEEGSGGTSILFGDYPWNQGNQTPLRRVLHWEEVPTALLDI